MTLAEIRKQAKNYKGMTFTASVFKYAFKQGMKELNTLVKEGTFKVSDKNIDGNIIYVVA